MYTDRHHNHPEHVGLPPCGRREPACALASSHHYNAAELRIARPLTRVFPLPSRDRLCRIARFHRAMATRQVLRITAPFIQCP
jgi:hypothetical protein